ncbi:lysophospholipid acyltransferase family protein [Pontibacter beigongshangensis]|uniref:lysophospholipid acyltransferase family protein n=1 Tax=Pontibacter beigongshangensis TaxID=2574733 RepID=UPI00164EEF39|nr:lysophospholipid acyltransferase family protein [Pontibacter beigongshangensis]
MLYLLLKLIVRAGLWVFFRKFEVRNRSRMPKRGPLLVVSNHPNTFMDPLVIAVLLRQQVFFITKGTVFNTPFKKWLLRHMNMIPIHRQQDAPGQRVNNAAAFQACFTALKHRKTLLIFPEGTSFKERRLRPLKTGTARMALGAEAAGAAVAGITILPVGLNYSDPTHFRSDVFVNVGKPIAAASFLPAYYDNAAAAANALTDHLRQQLERLIIVTPSDEDDALIRHIEQLYKRHLAAEVPADAPEHEQDFLITRAIANSLHYFNQNNPAQVETIKQQVKAYMLELEQIGLNDSLLSTDEEGQLWQNLKFGTYLLLGFPLYAYGLVNNYLPYIIPSKVANLLTAEEEFRAPVMLTVGIFSFPVLYLLQAFLFWKLNPAVIYLLLYLLSLPVSGFFTLHYWHIFKRAKGQWLLMRLFSKSKEQIARLRVQRQEIVDALELAKKHYLKVR